MGERLNAIGRSTSFAGRHNALLLLSPFVPMLFMGEEVASADALSYSSPATTKNWLSWCAKAAGRSSSTFAAFQDPARREKIPDPNAPSHV